MDQKYLAEIKARCGAVEASRYGKSGKSYGIACWKLKANALADIPTLFAEVERLRRQHELLANGMEAVIQGRDCYKKALSLAIEEGDSVLRKLVESGKFEYGDRPNTHEEQMNYFIQQAEEGQK